MATAQSTTPTPCDTLARLRQAQRELSAWVAHIEAYLAADQPGQAQAAARAAGIVTATLAEAACETRAVARSAREAAFLDAA